MPSPVGEGHCDDSVVTHPANSGVFVAFPFRHANQKTGVSAVRSKDGAFVVRLGFCVPTVVLLIFYRPFHVFPFCYYLSACTKDTIFWNYVNTYGTIL